MQVFAGIVIALLILLAFGWFYASKLPAEQRSESSVTVAMPQPELWNKLRDVQKYPEWRPSLRAVMVQASDSDGVMAWNEIRTRGVDKFRILSLVIPDSIQLEVVSERKTFQSKWVIRLEPVPPDSTRITIASTTILVAPFYRLSAKFFPVNNMGATSVLQALKSANN
jgi:ribosome-associated toxin RatA of RatAB toxin-antitoxin module